MSMRACTTASTFILLPFAPWSCCSHALAANRVPGESGHMHRSPTRPPPVSPFREPDSITGNDRPAVGLLPPSAAIAAGDNAHVTQGATHAAARFAGRWGGHATRCTAASTSFPRIGRRSSPSSAIDGRRCSMRCRRSGLRPGDIVDSKGTFRFERLIARPTKARGLP